MSSERSSITQELERIATFKDYPNGDSTSVITLARSGFIYAGREFRVKCPMCRIEIERFERGKDPLEEHRKRSPNCPLASPPAVRSVSPSAMGALSEDAMQSSLAMLEIYKSAIRRSGEDVLIDVPHANAVVSGSSPNNRVNRNDPDYELLRCNRYRLDTFYDWPATANAVPEELVREGLFYTGIGDKVRCAFCRNALHSWEMGDIPRDEHRKYFPNCPFVQNRYMENVQIENGSNQENFTLNPVGNASSISASSGQNADPVDPGWTNGTNETADVFMSTPTVRAVLEMGFSATVVKQTIQRQLDETGESYQNAEALLEKLFSLGCEIPSVPSIVETSMPQNIAPVVTPIETTSYETPSEQVVQQNTVVDPISQKSGRNKKHRVRKKKGGATTDKTTAFIGSAAHSSATGAALQTNNTKTTNTTASTASSTIEAEIYPEGVESNGVLLDLEEQELIEENTRLKEARVCKVCMDREVNTVFLPCGHLICCDTCSPKVQNCPLCRTFIRGTVKTYLS